MVTQELEIPPELREFVKKWQLLPPKLREAILAIAKSALMGCQA